MLNTLQRRKTEGLKSQCTQINNAENSPVLGFNIIYIILQIADVH